MLSNTLIWGKSLPTFRDLNDTEPDNVMASARPTGSPGTTSPRANLEQPRYRLQDSALPGAVVPDKAGYRASATSMVIS